MTHTPSPPADWENVLQRTQYCSRYARHLLDASPELHEWLRSNYHTTCTRAEISAMLKNSAPDPADESALAGAMRKLRKLVMLKLICRDVNGLADLSEVMLAMTALAEECLRTAHSCLSKALQDQFGTPLGEANGAHQELLIIAMGKLGGCELNVSSDIDLIFVYPEDGQTNGSRQISNHEFFSRMGRRLIGLINELGADGYVFRVDMRLRPYGDSGPLVMNFAALEEYLLTQGREWERYAWIKSRVVAPESGPQIGELMQLVQPFMFRKYLDFGAIDSMRGLHAQIRQEVHRRDRVNNIKLGPGGIREIEFIAQVFQLIRAGRDARLRIRPTQGVLQQLSMGGQLSAQIAADLNEAYVYLRNLEHRLQYLDDQQTQELPVLPDDQEIVAAAMGYADYSAMVSVLDRHRKMVSDQFEQIFGAQRDVPGNSELWRGDIEPEQLAGYLDTLGYLVAEVSAQHLQQLRDSSRYRQLPEQSRERMNKLIPQFITLSAEHRDPDGTLARLLTLLESISRRASYLAFLVEYPAALQRLTTLVASSTWAGDYLTSHPALLDELLDAREIYQQPDWKLIDEEVQRRIEDCSGDEERQLDALRQIHQEQTFHLLAMDLQGLLPLEKLSDHLSDLADLMLRHVLTLSWMTLRKRHRQAPKFAIIAYGKLGGKELGYASDLDLIFLYDDDHPDAQENYARLGQRINAMLSSYTSTGRLYEIDLRLRPNGASGLLVSSISAFAEYQEKHAWVWEHQALTRARYSAGDSEVGFAFEIIRKQILCQSRDRKALQQEIMAMRQKMHDGHANASDLFDIKHDTGGMVDIEFMVQYIVLAFSHQNPRLSGDIGNLALLKLAGTLGIIPADLAGKCCAIYRELRRTQHRMRLNNQSTCRIERGTITVDACLELWEWLFNDSLTKQNQDTVR
ncbi:MAG: bifunctional [glutamate--ammonia ligase]-adenylyl-L-tyrosine phosphorylase/[glutamate--ammonia-ligase] adenylyltransferase [Gallionella sp.]